MTQVAPKNKFDYSVQSKIYEENLSCDRHSSLSVSPLKENVLEEIQNTKMCSTMELPEDLRRVVETVLSESSKPMAQIRIDESLANIPNVEIKVNLVSRPRFALLKKYSKAVIREKKVFRVIGPKSVVIDVLQKRGWIHVFESHYKSNRNCKFDLSYSEAILSLPNIIPDEGFYEYWSRCEKIILSLLCVHAPINLIWSNLRWVDTKLLIALNDPDVILNKIGEPYFTPKNILAKCLRTGHWFSQSNTAKVHFPRTYLVSEEVELEIFENDYHITACLGFLKFIVEKTEKGGINSLFNEYAWHIPFSTFEFAMKQITELVKFDRDDSATRRNIVKWDWESFISYHLLLTSPGSTIIQAPPGKDIEKIIRKTKKIISEVSLVAPDRNIDGSRNIWILKPKHSQCGKGIVLSNRLDNIRQAVSKDYLVQKYIERPLLILNAKGDIRQFLLVTSILPLKIWMYKECYVRLSTQVFNLDNLDPAIHVTNFSVQKDYVVDPRRNPQLPTYNMLDTKSFQRYLQIIGKPKAWRQRIYPGMKRTIIACLLANQEYFIQKPNNFELFGADFIVDEDCTPWLLEINQNPHLAPSTPVTAKLCPQLVEDVFKVVLDRKENPRVNTGSFELIYNQSVTSIPRNKKYFFIQGQRFSHDTIRREMYQHLASLANP